MEYPESTPPIVGPAGRNPAHVESRPMRASHIARRNVGNLRSSLYRIGRSGPVISSMNKPKRATRRDVRRAELSVTRTLTEPRQPRGVKPVCDPQMARCQHCADGAAPQCEVMRQPRKLNKVDFAHKIKVDADSGQLSSQSMAKRSGTYTCNLDERESVTARLAQVDASFRQLREDFAQLRADLVAVLAQVRRLPLKSPDHR